MAAARTELSRFWLLDPAITFLNHGGFGACPVPVLEAQQRWRERIEREPTHFFSDVLEPLLDQARAEVAPFLGADADDLAFVSNATTGVNTVLRSLTFAAGDELLTTDHAYNACKNALDFVAARCGARVVVAQVPFPVAGEAQIVDAVLSRVTPRTRLALLDHVASPTGLVFPLSKIIRELSARGVQTLVDGAHAPGMLPLQLNALGATYYTGNFHKWVCAPKGAAFLWVHSSAQANIRPLTISHGANAQRAGRSRFRLEFDWMGTDDPTPFLCVPEAIRFMASLFPRGWDELRAHNHHLAVEGRRVLCRALDIEPPTPDDLIGALVAVPLPRSPGMKLQDALYSEHHIQLRIVPWPSPERHLLRVSAQVYGTLTEMEQLGSVLKPLLPTT